jgi:hypothetical protein
MNSPTDQKSTTRPVVGLTGKGRATVVLIRVRESWDSLTPDQRAEVAELVARLSAALRNEKALSPSHAGVTVRVPLVGRISA